MENPKMTVTMVVETAIYEAYTLDRQLFIAQRLRMRSNQLGFPHEV
jgi:hypothetical protein